MDTSDTFTLTLTKEQLKVISDGVIQLPYFRAQPVIEAINSQIRTAMSSSVQENE